MGYTEEIVKKKIEAITRKRNEKKVIRKKVKTSKTELKNKSDLKKIESILYNDKMSATKRLELIINQL